MIWGVAGGAVVGGAGLWGGIEIKEATQPEYYLAGMSEARKLKALKKIMGVK